MKLKSMTRVFNVRGSDQVVVFDICGTTTWQSESYHTIRYTPRKNPDEKLRPLQ